MLESSENVEEATTIAVDAGDPAAAMPEVAGSEDIVQLASEPEAEGSSPDWREELAAKMQEYRTRRKPREPKYPSLQLPFELPFETFRPASGEAASRSSLALDSSPIEPSFLDGPQILPALVDAPVPAESAPAMTNLIEFPRYADAPPRDELAEPLIEQPRILDAPEVVPPQPALGGILLEEPEVPITSVASEVPLQPASIARRLLALIVDLAFVGLAAALWCWTFWKMVHEIPLLPQLLVPASAILAALWLSYQYLLMVWSGTTLGLRACRLELVSLDGTIPERKRRGWRLLASSLSAASLMLGYAWVLLDENRLCWHDRITRTYLRVRER